MPRQINVRLTDDEYDAVKKQAERVGMTVTGYATLLVSLEDDRLGGTLADMMFCEVNGCRTVVHPFTGPCPAHSHIEREREMVREEKKHAMHGEDPL